MVRGTRDESLLTKKWDFRCSSFYIYIRPASFHPIDEMSFPTSRVNLKLAPVRLTIDLVSIRHDFFTRWTVCRLSKRFFPKLYRRTASLLSSVSRVTLSLSLSLLNSSFFAKINSATV